MRVSLRLYRLLLRLYPAGFRERFSAPLERDFQDDYAEVHGPGDAARFWTRTVADVGRSVPAQVAEEFRQDASHAFRLWRRRPLPTVFVIVVLATAIGANTGVFSVLNALLIRSLPFHEADRLASLYMFTPPGPPSSSNAFHTWRGQSAYLEDAAKLMTTEVTLEGSEDAQRIRLTETSWNFFELLGTRLAPGRGFAPDEDNPGHAGVAVIGRGLWAQRFGDDPRAIGASIRLNGSVFTIVGVAPAGFDYPQKTQVWTPTAFDWQRVSKTGVVFWVTIGRLRHGLTWDVATRSFETEAYEQSPNRRTADVANRPALIPLQTQLAGPVRKASLMLMGGVGLLLLLACANVASVLLSRTVARSTELMIRRVLGASRARLTQQLVIETLLLTGIAALCGLLAAEWT
ncbi:MAG TPA: ABC transporter permease, partial [Candidatus Krumholzibacteria bacterium]|nr:ABC transporter permease [Candidatus Krumholzibacteria bacterium]